MSDEWQPPERWQSIRTIEMHTAGEPLRVISGGFPELPGDTILAKRRFARENLDGLRTALMWEPRGHADMYGCIVTEPVTEDGDVGVLFIHNEGFSTMCGHGIIGLAKAALETGMIEKVGERPVIKMDTPAGRVTAYAQRENGRVVSVSFHNVPSFVYVLDQVVDVPEIGPVRYDVAYGGAFYAFCRAEDLSVDLVPSDFRKLIDIGTRVKQAVVDSLPLVHPFEEDLGFLYGTIIVGGAKEPGHHSRNVCIFANGEVDRCPTGTGVSARAAIGYARGDLQQGQPFIVESILGTTFTGKVVDEVQFGPYSAVVPEVTGSAHIVGRAEWLIDPDDPLWQGFILR